MDVEELIGTLHWLGHDSFRLDGPPVTYFDPVNLSGDLPQADLVLVSHEHGDHCSPNDVTKISGPNTEVIACATAAARLPRARIVRPGDHLAVAGAQVEAVPAYNVDKFRSPGVPFHPKEEEHVGYVITLEGIRLYFAGDTDAIPEMKDVVCDVALLPVSGTFVMTVEEAVEAARVLKPQVVIPMHYGAGTGTPEDGPRFAELYEGHTVILEQE
jgi:L-ascorbate metabolism protein UlaG (beta-lactamase superfamily)